MNMPGLDDLKEQILKAESDAIEATESGNSREIERTRAVLYGLYDERRQLLGKPLPVAAGERQ